MRDAVGQAAAILASQPAEWTAVCEAIKNDELIGPHVDQMVGTKFGGSRVEAASLLRSLLYGMLNDAGELEFTDERFNSKWADIRQGFEAHLRSLIRR